MAGPGLQLVAENVKAMAAMDVVLAAVVLRDEVANERLAALKSDAARAAFWPKVSIGELRARVEAMAPSSLSSRALLVKMSQKRTYLWYAVLMWCKAWVAWNPAPCADGGGRPRGHAFVGAPALHEPRFGAAAGCSGRR